jgi:hypothetical protein
MMTERIGALLLGWYLLFPPPSQPDAPLRQWQPVRARRLGSEHYA